MKLTTATGIAAAAMALLLSAGCRGTIAGTGTTTQGPTVQGTDCRSTPPALDTPTAASKPLFQIGSVSPWTPNWIQHPSVVVYADGTAVGAPADDPQSLRAPSAIPPALPVVIAQQGGWIDQCDLLALTGRYEQLQRRDMGRITRLMDGSTVQISRWDETGAEVSSIDVYALGLDEDSTELTATQREARAELSAWKNDVVAAIEPTGPLPVDRLLVVDAGPSRSTSPSRKLDTAVDWEGPVPAFRSEDGDDNFSAPCAVLTGDAADAAIRNMLRSRAANDAVGESPWLRGLFVIGGERQEFGMVALAPGQECR